MIAEMPRIGRTHNRQAFFDGTQTDRIKVLVGDRAAAEPASLVTLTR